MASCPEHDKHRQPAPRQRRVRTLHLVSSSRSITFRSLSQVKEASCSPRAAFKLFSSPKNAGYRSSVRSPKKPIPRTRTLSGRPRLGTQQDSPNSSMTTKNVAMFLSSTIAENKVNRPDQCLTPSSTENLRSTFKGFSFQTL